jgi:hypothetical protein
MPVPFYIKNFNGLEQRVTIVIRDVLGHKHELTVDAEGLAAWQLGKHIQEALPNLTAAQRELLITGIPESMWDDMFSEE